jgi:tetratricopeptide (TPR) repeat protein
LKPGDILGEHYEIERFAGEGGMGLVYRARDLRGGGPVALKVLRGGHDPARFDREAETLRGLRHPRIVGYVAHGRGREGPWLAMEWLEGESLADVLRRRRPSPGEALEILAQAAEGLSILHARGIVHRDVKPSNLFLVGGAVDRLKLLDFGTARRLEASMPLSRSGVVVGTPGYLAPEQVRGDAEPDPRVDVFALGCVLYECLTARPAFRSDHALAVLAKILLEPTPRAGASCPDLPPALDALTARLMAKERAERPADAAAVLAEIAALPDGTPGPPTSSARNAALSMGEQRMLSVILAMDDGGGGDRGAATVVVGDTMAEAQSTRTPAGPRQVAARFGARLEEIGGGALAATLELHGSATDHAAQAARCALALRERLPEARLSLATGRGEIAGRMPVGDAIDRAATLLVEAKARSDARGVWLDEATAGLLDGRFEVETGAGVPRLASEHAAAEATRARLGAETPFVGRDREISFLVELFDACATDPRARAVLVTGPAGIGKSRLVAELSLRLATRDDAPEVLYARGDPMRAGSPFGLLAPALRRAAGIDDGEPAPLSRSKLRALVRRSLPEGDAERVAEFLGELAGTPFPDAESARLSAARRAPQLMADQIRAAFRTFIGAQVARGPVLVVLEDLHWGDPATVRLLEHTIRHLADRPILVLGLARPDLVDRAPALAFGRDADTLQLGGLSRRAGEALVRASLGRGASDALVARLAERGAGNPLYLEELARAAAAGRDRDLPGSVLAIVAARLEELEPGARRVLRAASVFGQRFHRDGVVELLGGEARREDVEAWLAALVEREIVLPRADGEGAYAFRHALFRDAAHALLTDADRALGHRLAGEWLERAGEDDPATLAEHFERGGRPARAAGFLLAAAQRAFHNNEARAALDFAERAARAGLEGEALGRARVVEARAQVWLGNFDAASDAADAARALVPRGSDAWYEALGVTGVIAQGRGPRERLLAVADDLESSDAGTTAHLSTCARVTTQLAFTGELRRAARLLDGIAPRAAAAGDPLVLAHFFQARATLASFAGEAHAALRLLEASAQHFEQIGDARGATIQRANWGSMAIELGGHAEAARALREVIAAAEPLGLPGVIATARHNLGVALARCGDLDEAREVEAEAARMHAAQGDQRLEGSSRAALAEILAMGGDLDAAEAEAARAVALLAVSPPLRAVALAVAARLRLARGRVEAAVEAAGEAHAILTSLGGIEERESLVRLAWAEALEASGRRDEAAAALAEGARILRDRAERIEAPAWRERFLTAVPENARTLDLAGRRAGP